MDWHVFCINSAIITSAICYSLAYALLAKPKGNLSALYQPLYLFTNCHMLSRVVIAHFIHDENIGNVHFWKIFFCGILVSSCFLHGKNDIKLNRYKLDMAHHWGKIYFHLSACS